ncbi:tetratricopeptide repeat family protein [Calothrix sp. NIES-3974]|nr:tetratricopeptide repeat family protein [Calothrix sp. NIES-3974]
MMGTRHRKKMNVKKFTPISLLVLWVLVVTGTVELPLISGIKPAVAQRSNPAVQRGYNLLQKGWVNDAIAAFRQALRRDPNSLRAKLGLAIGLKRAGKLDEAWNAYQGVLAQDPNNQLALKTVGLFGTYRPSWQVQGIQALTKLLTITPNDMEARSLRALLYLYQGQMGASIADYRIVLDNNPSDEAILGAAQAFSYAGDFAKSLELFNRYRNKGKPITDFAAIAYGRSLRESGDSAAAVRILEAQLQRSPSGNIAIETRKELAIAYLDNQQPEKAVSVLQPLRGRNDAILPLARALNEIRKRTNDAGLSSQISSLYQQALQNEPNPSPSLIREVADVFTGLPGGEQTALQLYRQLVQRQPNDKSLVVRQLALEAKLGTISRDNLRSQLASALQPLPREEGELQQLALALAEITTPDPEFLPIYQNLVQTQATVPLLHFRIAQIYLEMGDTAGARNALAAYTNTPQGRKDMAHQLLAAEIERREGNFDGSAKRYIAIINANPDRADIVNGALRGLAGLRRQQRRFDEALEIYDQLIVRNPQSQNLQLGRTAIAYLGRRISEAEARAVLENWLATQPATNAPPELYTLVEALPVYPEREALYNYLAELEPNNIPMQLRLIQAIAMRNPAEARARVRQISARLPQTPSSFNLQAQFARAAGDLNYAAKLYEQLVATQPDDMEALAALAGIRFEQQRFETARNIYSRILEEKPQDRDARRAVADLTAILDQPLTALSQMEQLQIEQMREGASDEELAQRMQQIQEEFLLRRGFQPPWEDYQRRRGN